MKYRHSRDTKLTGRLPRINYEYKKVLKINEKSYELHYNLISIMQRKTNDKIEI